jgi:hypothetical protein
MKADNRVLGCLGRPMVTAEHDQGLVKPDFFIDKMKQPFFFNELLVYFGTF